MNRFMKQFVLWAAVILVVAYLAGVDPVTLITNLIHGAQSIHNSHHH